MTDKDPLDSLPKGNIFVNILILSTYTMPAIIIYLLAEELLPFSEIYKPFKTFFGAVIGLLSIFLLYPITNKFLVFLFKDYDKE